MGRHGFGEAARTGFDLRNSKGHGALSTRGTVRRVTKLQANLQQTVRMKQRLDPQTGRARYGR